jgi:hypothetical protein
MEGRGHATPIVSPALIVVHRHVASSHRCLQLATTYSPTAIGSTKHGARDTRRHTPSGPMIKAAPTLPDQQRC